MDALWDPHARLLWCEPAHALAADGVRRHMVRESVWYALGLCLRDDPGDVARANEIVGVVLALQYRAPGAVWHGTWPRAPEDAPPPPDAVVWRDYDPNWRQFIGATLLVLLRDFGALLDAALRVAIDAALRAAVLGEPQDRVTAAYTNIAMLRAWLEVEVGAQLGEPAWVVRGAALAAAVEERYVRFGALDEFNSPTYYGVDLLAAALWARRSARLAAAGARMEALLWQDIADFYHAGLGNLCGPYARAYGMDLRAYVGLVSLWLAQVDSGAPLPPITAALEHGHDVCLAPFIGLLGARLPPALQGAAVFGRFGGERLLKRTLPSGAVASAWLGTNVMIGGLRGGKAVAQGQYHPATVHWRADAGSAAGVRAGIEGATGVEGAREAEGAATLHWLRLRSAGPLHASAAAGVLTVESRAGQDIALETEVGTAMALPAAGVVRLPGARIEVTSSTDPAAGTVHRLGVSLR